MDNSDSGYSGLHNYLFNLGYTEASQQECTITFGSHGVYKLDNIRVVCQPLQLLSGQAAALNQDKLTNVKQKANYISGEINLKSKKILCLSIPYSIGWSATVNGKHVKLEKANEMFSAITLGAGESFVELRYTTPYMHLGALISIITFIGIMLFLMFLKRSKNKST